MELNYHNILLKISNLTTVSSYIKGTLIFTLFTITEDNNDLVMIGFFFVVLAVLTNIIVFGVSLATALLTKYKELKQKYWIAIAFQLANVPIAYAYFYYVMNFGGLNI
jgi:lysylphosphatidylglycerol synthetase-like protein (DUF2156 family)